MRTRRFKSSSDPVPSARNSRETGHRTQAASQPPGHTSVLLHEAIEHLAIRPSDTVVDATLGGAGHARAMAELLGEKGVFIGIDADEAAVKRAEAALKDLRKPEIHLVTANFRNLPLELEKLGIARIDKALFDLGWSGYQLSAGRGFSFQTDEPLLMTYAEHPGPDEITAGTIVNEWAEESIADIIFGWGEERYARRIAKRIVERRAERPFRTARELADAIREAVPPAYRFGRIHPATRTFQALRIAVNDEMGALETGLAGAWERMREGGRIAVITFHSVEDRAVKRVMAGWETAGEGKRIVRSPIKPSREETLENPRARSAKLRVIEKIISHT